MSSPVDMEMNASKERGSFLDEVEAIAANEPVPVVPPVVPETPPEVKPEPGKEAAPVVPETKPEVKPADPTDPLERLSKKKVPEPAKKPEEKPTEGAKVPEKPVDADAEAKKQYKWGELRKAAEEDLPAAIADRDKAIAERDRIAKENADLKAVAAERDDLKKESEELRTRLYVHDVRELPQYKENREVIDFSMEAMKKAAEIHKFPVTALHDALAIVDPTERASKVDEVFDSASNPIGSTSRARLAGMVEDVSGRRAYENYLETNQKAALEAHKMHEAKRSHQEESKAEESYKLAADEAFEKLKAGIPLLADEALAKRVRDVPRISKQSPALQAAAAFALNLLPDLLDRHEEEIAGYKAHSAEKDEKIKELEEVVAKYSGAGNGVKPSGGEVKTEVKAGNFMEELEAAQKAGIPIS